MFFFCFCYQIWDKSDDENMEIFMDHCIRKIKSFSVIWDELNDIKMLYEDGTYYNFVKKIYNEARGNEFFDNFIDQNYEREINIWRHRMESQKELVTKEQIFGVLQKMDFKDFRIDKDDKIDKDEFKKCFKRLGYFVDTTILENIFDEIDAMRKMEQSPETNINYKTRGYDPASG